MTVSATQLIGGGAKHEAPTETSAAKSLADSNSFLLMFTTQLQYQDPMNPLEPHEMSAQLAQFSSVEKLTSIYSSLEDQKDYLASLNNAQAAQLLGKEVDLADNRLRVEGESITKGGYDLPESAEVEIKIYDKSGNVVRTLDPGKQEAGSYEIQWDGLDDSGEAVPEGTYTFEVSALNEAETFIDITSKVSGTVYGFRLEDGVPYLILDGPDGARAPLGSLLQAYEPRSTETS